VKCASFIRLALAALCAAVFWWLTGASKSVLSWGADAASVSGAPEGRARRISRWLGRAFDGTDTRVVCFVPEYEITEPPLPALRAADQPTECLAALTGWVGGQATVVGGVHCVSPSYRRDAGWGSLTEWMSRYGDLNLIRFLGALPDSVWQRCYPTGWASWGDVPAELVRSLDERDPSLLSGNFKGLPEEGRRSLEFRVAPVLRVWVRYRNVGVAGSCLWQRLVQPGANRPHVVTAKGERRVSSSLAEIGARPRPDTERMSGWSAYAARSLQVREPLLSVPELCQRLGEATKPPLRVVPAKTIAHVQACLTPGEYLVPELADGVAAALQLRWRWFKDQGLMFLADDLYAAGRRHVYGHHDRLAVEGWRALRNRLTDPTEVRRAIDPFGPEDFFQFRPRSFLSLTDAQKRLVSQLLTEGGHTLSDVDASQLDVTAVPGAELYYRAPNGWWTGGGPETLLYELMPSLAR